MIGLKIKYVDRFRKKNGCPPHLDGSRMLYKSGLEKCIKNVTVSY